MGNGLSFFKNPVIKGAYAEDNISELKIVKHKTKKRNGRRIKVTKQIKVKRTKPEKKKRLNTHIKFESDSEEDPKQEEDETHADTIKSNEEEVDPSVIKYYAQRYTLFSRFDQGIKMDTEGWYSVTPEKIAKSIASRFKGGIVIDAFCGVGGNSIQLAMRCDLVIAIDIDPLRLAYARHNARVYNVDHKIEFILGDFFKLAPSLQADYVFLSPPWGGPEYLNAQVYDLDTMMLPISGLTIFAIAMQISQNIAYFIPRNSDMEQVHELAKLTDRGRCHVQEHLIKKKVKAITVYYGSLCRNK